MSNRHVFISVGLISALTLNLELLQTRILSVALWYHFVYIVITMALLGFATSGTVLAISARLRELNNKNFYFLCLFGFSLSAYICSKFSYYPIRNFFSIAPEPNTALKLVTAYIISMLPYFFAGLVLIGSFMRYTEKISTLYFFNLIGSGLGCIFFIASISFLGASRLLWMTSLISLIPLASFVGKEKHLLIPLYLWILFIGIGLFSSQDSQLNRILPEAHKQFWTMYGKDTVVEHTEWNPISRVDVVSKNKYSLVARDILMDGDAQATLPTIFNLDACKKGMIPVQRLDGARRGVVYYVMGHSPEKVLVIGAGGGADVYLAWAMDAKRVDAVELNPTTARLVKTDYATFLDNLFSRPEIKLYVEDGRSFVRRSMDRYDVIMLFATDTLLALSTGAYTLADNYLYTKEALVDYLGHLSEDGFINIGRWHFKQEPRESLRVFATALEACRANRYKNPLEHVVALDVGDGWANIIIKRTPFTVEEKKRFEDYCVKGQFKILFSKDLFDKIRQIGVSSPFLELADYYSHGQENKFYERYLYNVRPVTDDSPFFYQYEKWHSMPHAVHLTNKFEESFEKIRGVWHIFVLSFLLIHICVLSFLLISLPLIITGMARGSLKGHLFTLVYCGAIGIAFLFVEMALIQKFILFLGHPIFSMAVVMPTLLIFAGLGSFCSRRCTEKALFFAGQLAFLCSLIILLLVLFLPNLSGILLLQPLFIRIIVSIVVIAPLAFVMGFPFPLALRIVSMEAKELMPWAWAVNGCFSVLASILAVMIAMRFGFWVVLIIAAIFYGIASLSTLLYNKNP